MSDERDRWLQQALRHAPDADAAPPPALSATILREARAAVAPAPARGPAAWLASAWQSLASPRLAGALASLMVLTLAGVMWWGRPIEDAMPAREPAAAAPVAPAEAARAEPAAPPAPGPAMQAAPPAAYADKAPPAERRRVAPASPAAPAVKPRAPSAAPAPTTAEIAPPAPAVADAAAPGLARQRAEPPREAEAGVPARNSPDTAMAPAPAPPAAPALTAPAKALAAAPKREAGAAGATSWDRGDGRARPVDAAFETFLAQLDAATATARQATMRAAGSTAPADAAKAAEAAGAAAEAAPLNLLRDGRALRTLRLAGDTLIVEAPGQPPQRLPLAPGAGAALAARLAELSR